MEEKTQEAVPREDEMTEDERLPETARRIPAEHRAAFPAPAK